MIRPVTLPPTPHSGNARLDQQLAFLLEIDALKQVLRRSYRLDGAARENTAEHSWHVVMMAMTLAEHADGEVDVPVVMKMLAVHDIVEIDAGDTFVYDHVEDDNAGASKQAAESAAADRIFGLLPPDQARDLRALWDEYEFGTSANAQFARSLDRLMPLLHNFHTEGRTWREHGVTARQVRALHQHTGKGSAAIGRYALALVDEAVRRGYLDE